MTFEEATAQLVAAREALPGLVTSARDQVGELAAEEVAAEWPRDSGRSAEAWTFTDGAVRNNLPYVPYVHDGLADVLVPETLRRQEQTFGEIVSAQLDAILGG